MMGNVANQPKTPHRTIRVSHDIWNAAQEKAKTEGRTLSELIREFLTDYLNNRDATRVERIETILDGIDRVEDGTGTGWWATSVGAEFGTEKLAQIRDAITGRGDAT